jgi:hypothetical protein
MNVVVLLMVGLAPVTMTHAAETKIADKDVTFELYTKDQPLKTDANIKVYGGTVLQGDIGSPKIKTAPIYSNMARAQIRVDDASKFLIFLEIKHPRGTYAYTIRPGHKTVYLTFNPEKSPAVYPQTGPLKGFLGKTETGLPLKNNVSASNIVQGDTRTMMEKLGSR